ncbi:MAG: OmpA family protein [Thermoanaerobaculia bacterium]
MKRFYLLFFCAFFVFGCATKKFVNEEIQKTNKDVSQRIENVQKDVEQAQEEIQQLHQKDKEIEEQIAKLSDTSREAMERALEAKKLAEGKFLYEVILSDDKVHFGSNKYELSLEAQAALDAFAQILKNQNKNVYIEIQGHTDDLGSEEYNYKLGLKRAEEVKYYLNREHGIPLHRMEVISYGETKPLVPNTDSESRAKNRRVVLVVME